MEPLIASARKDFHIQLLSDTLLATKKSSPEATQTSEDMDLSPVGVRDDESQVPASKVLHRGMISNADSANKASIALAWKIADALGKVKSISKKPAPQTLGNNFEKAVFQFLERTFPNLEHLRPGQWDVKQLSSRSGLGIAQFQQYRHLDLLSELARQHRELATVIGNEYLVAPDIIIARQPEPDDHINKRAFMVVNDTTARSASLRRKFNPDPILHASVSCKWTIRSDRSQNSRSEALNLIRNRKGRNPHVIVVTAEPLPGRIASVALGTGDIDCVYHFALYELILAAEALELSDSIDTLQMLVNGKRLRDISDLPLDLAV